MYSEYSSTCAMQRVIWIDSARARGARPADRPRSNFDDLLPSINLYRACSAFRRSSSETSSHLGLTRDPGSSSRGVSAERKMFAMKLVCMESLIVIATLLSTTYTASPLIGRPRPLTTKLEYLHRAAEIF